MTLVRFCTLDITAGYMMNPQMTSSMEESHMAFLRNSAMSSKRSVRHDPQEMSDEISIGHCDKLQFVQSRRSNTRRKDYVHVDHSYDNKEGIQSGLSLWRSGSISE